MILGVSGLPKSGKTTFINKFLNRLDIKYISLDTKRDTIDVILKILNSQNDELVLLEGNQLFLYDNMYSFIDIKIYIYNKNIDTLDLLDKKNMSKSDLIIPINNNYTPSIDILIDHI